MSRPTSIVICGQPFVVAHADLGEHEAGSSRLTELRILIARSLVPEQERDTVLHEVIHMVAMMTGYDPKEGMVTALATGLLGVLRANPALVVWLIEDVK